MSIFDHISLSSSQKGKCFRQKLQRKSKHTFYVQQLFSENCALYEITWKNIVQPERPQMIKRRMRILCWILRLQTLLKYVTLTALYCNNGCTKALQCYDIRTLSVLLTFLIKTNRLHLPYISLTTRTQIKFYARFVILYEYNRILSYSTIIRYNLSFI